MQAIERYDGPVYKVIRRYLKETEASTLDTKILSAKYGLISSAKHIPNYDFRMSNTCSEALNSKALGSLKIALDEREYTNFLICLGKDYLRAVSGYEKLVPNTTNIKIANGGMGRKLSILKSWLYDDFKTGIDHSHIKNKQKVIVKGIEIELTAQQILALARENLTHDNKRAFNCQTWYVPVDSHQISPKWLISQITGLSVSCFHTDTAIRALQKLGITVLSNLTEL